MKSHWTDVPDCDPFPKCVFCRLGREIGQPGDEFGLCAECFQNHSLGLCESLPGRCDACKLIGGSA